ncbi:MAG: CPBP family intramembrane metalloprotease [Anaerolineae bacterium]|nr:CPBP family intramembrane metalloprotease [Anaerolineae bacterium]
MRTLFKSQDGQLRLFWRLLSYAALYLAVGLAANQAHSALSQPDSVSLPAEVVFAAIFVPGSLGLTYLYRRRLDRKPWSGMALPPLQQRWGDLAKGSVWLPLLMPAPLIVLAFAVGQARIAGTEASGSGLLTSALFALAGLSNCFVIGFCEELAIRGYVFQNLGERFPLWLATLFTGLIFGLLHFWGGLSVATVLSMAAMSTVFVTLRLYTGSIWAAIGLHTAFNWVYTSLLGFSSNDGGYGHALLHIEILTGPETAAAPVNPILGNIGSVLPNVVACGLVVLALLVWNRRRGRRVNWRANLESDGNIAQAP